MYRGFALPVQGNVAPVPQQQVPDPHVVAPAGDVEGRVPGHIGQPQIGPHLNELFDVVHHAQFDGFEDRGFFVDDFLAIRVGFVF